MGLAFIMLLFWIQLMFIVVPQMGFVSLWSLLYFLAWAFLVTYCSFYMCILILFSGRKRKDQYWHEMFLVDPKKPVVKKKSFWKIL